MLSYCNQYLSQFQPVPDYSMPSIFKPAQSCFLQPPVSCYLSGLSFPPQHPPSYSEMRSPWKTYLYLSLPPRGVQRRIGFTCSRDSLQTINYHRRRATVALPDTYTYCTLGHIQLGPSAKASPTWIINTAGYNVVWVQLSNRSNAYQSRRQMSQ